MSDVPHEERPVWISLNDVRCVVLSCSPHDPEALAVGHLLSEGWIDSIARVQTVRVVDGPGGSVGVAVHAASANIDATQDVQRHQMQHGCGLRHVLDCDRAAPAAVRTPSGPIDTVHLLRELFAAVDRDAPDGGLHAIAISDGDELVTIAYDVARHCAVDRAIGAAARGGVALTGAGLVSTARVSGSMALKAVRSGIGWIAGRSIATSLAREIAATCGLALFERAGKARR